MRIVYVGNFRHSWCTEVHVSRDAERIPGVEVVRVQEPQHPVNHERFLKELEVVADDAQLLIYQRTWGLPPEAIDLWRRLEARGCKTMSYHLDLYVGLKREATVNEDDPFWMTGTVFTADGDPETQRALHAMGVDHRWMPAAIVSDEVGEEPARQQRAQVVFVGSSGATYHEEWPWRAQLLDGLMQKYGTRFERWATDKVGRLHGRRLSQFYSSAVAVVGDSLALPGHRNYWSDRYYETVGRAGYLIGPNVPGIGAHFTSGEHLVLYDVGDLDHVYELVDEAIADPIAAREIARAGMEHVRANHTYRHRVEAILESLRLTP